MTMIPSIGRQVHYYAPDGSGPFAATVAGGEAVYASGACGGALTLAVILPPRPGVREHGSVGFVFGAKELDPDTCTCDLVDGWRWPPRVTG